MLFAICGQRWQNDVHEIKYSVCVFVIKHEHFCFSPLGTKTHLHAPRLPMPMPRLPMPRLPLGGSLITPKSFSTGATLHVGPIRLHVGNWECRALKSSARCQKFGVPC